MQKPTIVVVDPIETHQTLLESALKEKFGVVIAANLESVPDLTEVYIKALVVNYTFLNTAEFALFKSKIQALCHACPVIVVLDTYDAEKLEQSFTLGASTVLTFPTTFKIVKHKLEQSLQLVGLRSLLKHQQQVSADNWNVMDNHMMFLYVNRSGQVTFFSQALSKALALEKNEALGHSFCHFAVRHRSSSAFYELCHSGLCEQLVSKNQFTVRDLNEHQQENWFQIEVMPRFDEQQKWIGHSIFYTSLNEQLRLKQVSGEDVLTHVANRLTLNTVLKNEIERANRLRRTFSVVMFDIDRFREINNAYGYLVGDKVLQKVCQLISKRLRKIDILGRWDDEAFMVICPHTDESGATQLARVYQQLITESDFAEVQQVSCSFGVAEYPLDTQMNLVIEHADKALYHAKSHGKNRVEYFSQIEHEISQAADRQRKH